MPPPPSNIGAFLFCWFPCLFVLWLMIADGCGMASAVAAAWMIDPPHRPAMSTMLPGRPMLTFNNGRLVVQTKRPRPSSSRFTRSMQDASMATDSSEHDCPSAGGTNSLPTKGNVPSSPSSSFASSVGNTSLPKIITCSSSRELVHAVAAYVQPHHNVAELGSQLRDVSQDICQRCHSAVLVDRRRKHPRASPRTNAMRLDPTDGNFLMGLNRDLIQFREIDDLSDWRTAFFPPPAQPSSSSSSSSSYDVLVLDVNTIVGNDLEWTALSLILEFEALTRMECSRTTDPQQHTPREGESHDGGLQLILVKSGGLNQFACQLTHAQNWIAERRDRIDGCVPVEGSNSDDRQGIAGPIQWKEPSPYRSSIVASCGVHEYRQTIPVTVQPNDFVLEVGCHFGTSTAILHQHAKRCMGVDVGVKVIREAQQRYPHMFFRLGDAWKTAELLRIQQEYYRCNGMGSSSGSTTTQPTRMDHSIGIDVIYVDVGGLSGSDGLMDAISLVTSLQHSLEPRCIVIKSLCMQRLSSRIVPYWTLQKNR